MDSHHRLAPSARGIWGNCSGQVRLLRDLDLPADPGSFASAQGTVAHTVLAGLLLAVQNPWEWALDPTPSYLELWCRVEEVIVQDGHKIILDAEMANSIGHVLHYIADTLIDAGQDARICVEHRVDFGSQLKKWPRGTADVLIVSADGRSLWVIDLKYGAGVDVVPRNNPQLQTYALATAATFEIKPDTIHLVIHQPRKGGLKISTHTWDECRVWWDELEREIAAVDSVAGSRALSVGSWCRWCRCKPQCPAHNGLTQQVIQQVGVPSWNVSTLTDTELGERMTVAKAVLMPLIKEIDEEVSRRLHAGQGVPGYKLVAGRGSRQWTDEESVMAFLMDECELGREDICNSELRSPAQIEKRIKEKGWLVSLKTLTSQFIESIPSKNKLVVPDEDSRPAVTVTSGDTLPADVLAKLRADSSEVLK